MLYRGTSSTTLERTNWIRVAGILKEGQQLARSLFISARFTNSRTRPVHTTSIGPCLDENLPAAMLRQPTLQ